MQKMMKLKFYLYWSNEETLKTETFQKIDLIILKQGK